MMLLDATRLTASRRRIARAGAVLAAAIALAGCTPDADAEISKEDGIGSDAGAGIAGAGEEGVDEDTESSRPIIEELVVGDLSLTEVEVGDDGLGDFIVNAKVTNTSAETRGCIVTAYVFSAGSVVGRATATIPNLAAGETRDATFRGVDDYSDDWDSVTFQVDAQF